MLYWGFVDSMNGAAAPFLAREFGLDDVGITRTFGWMSIGAVGTYALARWADRTGRRRVLLWTVLLLGPLSLASALAPGLGGFVAAQIGLWGLKGLLAVLLPVMVTEVLPTAERARGQGWVGFAGSLGAGLAFILIASLEDVPGSWRWGWVVASLVVLAVPFLRRAVRESHHYERVATRGDTAETRVRDLLGPEFRTRTVVVVAIGTLFPFVIAGTQSWFIYYPVEHLGLAPLVATASVLVGGTMSLGGFPLGGFLSERFGRRPTFAVAGLLYAVANYAYYHVGTDFPVHPALGLILSLAVLTLLSAIAAVPFRATATEIFPTALRATVSGATAMGMGVGTVAAYFAASGLSAWLGGLPAAASALGLGLPLAALLFLFFLPESRGLDLELQDDARRGGRRSG